jgi:hypothetical protein
MRPFNWHASAANGLCAPLYQQSEIAVIRGSQPRFVDGGAAMRQLTAHCNILVVFDGRSGSPHFRICRDMHDAGLRIRKVSLSARLPSGRIGRFATRGTTLETSVMAGCVLECRPPKTSVTCSESPELLGRMTRTCMWSENGSRTRITESITRGQASR